MNVAGTRDDYEGGLRRGVEQACERHDLDLYVYAGRSTYDETSEAQRSIYQLVDPETVDAVIVASGVLASFVSQSELAALVDSYQPLPVVALGPPITDVPSVSVDNQAGARSVVEHLVVSHQRKQFVCVTGPPGNPEAVERLAAYRATLRERGLDLPEEAVAYGEFSEESGRLATERMIATGRRFDALLAANDYMAAGALRALKTAGLRCPQDVAVVGFDDASASRYCEPPLTTARQPLARQGMTAVEVVRRLWAGRTVPAETIIGVNLAVRESCGCGVLDYIVRSGTGTAESSDERLAALLGVMFSEPSASEHGARLAAAVRDAVYGDSQELAAAFTDLFSAAVEGALRIDLLPSVVECVRGSLPDRPPELEDLLHWMQVDAGRWAYRAQGRRNVEAERSVYNVRVAWERLATALRLDRLSDAMGEELPRQGVKNALVAVYDDPSLETLVPLVSVRGGERIDPGVHSYPARKLVPPTWSTRGARASLSVMPLTFQREQLGVAILGTGGSGFQDLLREQIGGALKRAAIHEELLRQTRLHARSREEERATAERLKSLHLVAGGVAHDLNNALGPLVALPEAIRRDLETKPLPEALPTVLEDLETMQVAAQRASLTIRDLMDLGRPSRGQRDRLDLRRLLEGPWQRRFEEILAGRNAQARLVIEVPATSLVVRVSESHLERCLINLLLNAADALREPGTVTVRVVPTVWQQPYLGFERVEAGSYVCIEVQDTGIGIPLEKLQRVTEPFYTDKERSEDGGTGLGLAIVHRFVKDADGYLDIESEVGAGSVFRILLPQTGLSRSPSRPPVRDSRGNGERILVVDDEPVQRRTAKRVLVELGYEVTCVSCGEEAVRLFQPPRCEQFDLVILDMVMGDGLDGVETFRRILVERPGQKALIASGYASEQKGSDAASLGLDWLTKPYTFDGLGSAVSRVLSS